MRRFRDPMALLPFFQVLPDFTPSEVARSHLGGYLAFRGKQIDILCKILRRRKMRKAAFARFPTGRRGPSAPDLVGFFRSFPDSSNQRRRGPILYRESVATVHRRRRATSPHTGDVQTGRLELKVPEVRPQFFPQRPLAAELGPHRPEQGAGTLDDLVDQKGQHHQHREHHRQVDVPVAEVVFELVPLVLQCFEGLVLDLPATAAPPATRDGALSRVIFRFVTQLNCLTTRSAASYS